MSTQCDGVSFTLTGRENEGRYYHCPLKGVVTNYARSRTCLACERPYSPLNMFVPHAATMFSERINVPGYGSFGWVGAAEPDPSPAVKVKSKLTIKEVWPPDFPTMDHYPELIDLRKRVEKLEHQVGRQESALQRVLNRLVNVSSILVGVRK